MAEHHATRSRTPESPRPVHIPEPSAIPVLANQMDPVFNDTNTYNIPSDVADHDAVATFFREAENQTVPEAVEIVPNPQDLEHRPEINLDQSSVLSSNTQTLFPDAQQTQDSTDPATEHTSERQTQDPQGLEHKVESGVDYQSLLDTIAQSASTAPSTDVVPAVIAEPPASDSPSISLPSFAGLPKKPPPPDAVSVQDMIIQPNDSHSEVPAARPDDSQLVVNVTAQAGVQNAEAFATNLTNEQAIAMHMDNQQREMRPDTPPPRALTSSADRPWTPTTQAVYDGFLEDERHYVTEGIWDRFPAGSRLFVGNLPSEKVTKRDLFHKFHRHGKLAQISIKQAYGFVQYHDHESCLAALNAEQNTEIRGRKVHLEISKPQKNTKGQRNNNASNNNSSNPTRNRQRSRSPQRRAYSDYRDEPSRKRQEYRRRSPSPGYRRDDFRSSGRDERRSPIYGHGYSSQPPAFDDEASLPYPRREFRSVPDVQLIVKEASVHQSFINWVEDNFKRKGVSIATTWLNVRTPLPAVLKRQIVEGVQAVVELDAQVQSRSKIPLKVFNRVPGSTNVTWSEYADLDVSVAADVVINARRQERGNIQPPRPQFPAVYPSAQLPYQQPPPSNVWSPHAQFPPTPQSQTQPPTPQFHYPPQQQQYPSYPLQPQQLQQQQSQPPSLQELLANLKGGPPAPPALQSAHPGYGPPQGQHSAQVQWAGQPNAQNILAELTRYNNR